MIRTTGYLVGLKQSGALNNEENNIVTRLIGFVEELNALDEDGELNSLASEELKELL